MEERGVFVDHSSINRWAIRFLPLLEKVFRKHKHPVGGSWRMDETYIKVKGDWKYLYRAVDKEGKTVDFLLTATRDKAAALRFFEKAMKASGVPEKVCMDKSGANKAAMDEINARGETPIIERPSQIPEQHRPAGPPGSEASHQTDAQLQVISSRQMCTGLHRIDAHDSQRTAHAGGLQREVFCPPILCIGRANPSSLRKWHSPLPKSRSSVANATEPFFK